MLFSLFLSSVLAATPSSSVCVRGTGGLCFAINVPTDAPNDLFFKVTGSSGNQYTGIGIGRAMAGSMMVLLFPQPGGTVTASMRLATGRSRPALAASTTTVEVLEGSTSQGGKFTANVRCRNCRSWTGGSIATAGTQEFIYAYGTATGTEVGDKGVTTYHGPLSRGRFQLPLDKAVGPGGVPVMSRNRVIEAFRAMF